MLKERRKKRWSPLKPESLKQIDDSIRRIKESLKRLEIRNNRVNDIYTTIKKNIDILEDAKDSPIPF